MKSSIPGLLRLAALLALVLILGPSSLANRRDEGDPWPVNPYFGVNAHMPSTEGLDAVAKAGFGFARIDLTWNVIEPRRGEYRWNLVDPIVDEAEARGIKLLGILGYCPKWAASGPDAFYPPKNVGEWREFVTVIVARYRGRIRHWTLWNEPNSGRFFHGNIDQFINLVFIPGAEAAHFADPDCKVVGPDLAHLKGARWDKWFDTILARAGGHLDVISHHCYKDKPAEIIRLLEGPSRPWDPPPVREIIDRRGQKGKPFWLTETGWRSDKIGPQRQSGYLISLLKQIQKRGWITKIFLFELFDSPQEPGFGLMFREGQPKPAYTAVRGFIAAGPR